MSVEFSIPAEASKVASVPSVLGSTSATKCISAAALTTTCVSRSARLFTSRCQPLLECPAPAANRSPRKEPPTAQPRQSAKLLLRRIYMQSSSFTFSLFGLHVDPPEEQLCRLA